MFNIAVNKIQENLGKQLNELRNKIDTRKEYFTKEIKTINKHQAQKIEKIREEIISDLEARNLLLNQVEEMRELRVKKNLFLLYEDYLTTKNNIKE